MFSDQVLAHPSIKDKFNEALDIMNRAVSSSVGRWLMVMAPLTVMAVQQRLVLVSLHLGMAWLIGIVAAPMSSEIQSVFYLAVSINNTRKVLLNNCLGFTEAEKDFGFWVPKRTVVL